MRKVNHFGIPTTIAQPGECYAEGLKVWLTDFTKSKNRLNFCVFATRDLDARTDPKRGTYRL